MDKEIRYFYNAEHVVQLVTQAAMSERTLSTHSSFVVVNGGNRGRSVFRAANLELAYRWQKVTGWPTPPLLDLGISFITCQVGSWADF